MELKGNIDDYGVADIFQLIGQQRRSGVLTIRSGKMSAEVIFVEGMISRSQPSYQALKKNPVGECALRARLINENNLQKALAVQERTMKPLEDVLLELRYLDQMQIQKLYEFLLRETLYDALQWRSGEYEFVVQDVEHDGRFSELVGVDRILLDILRMIDEEPEQLRRIASYSIIYERTAAAESVGSASSAGVGAEAETYEDVVIGFVNGENTVQDIIDQSLFGRYHTVNALISLSDCGRIRRSVAVRVAPQKQVVRDRKVVAYASGCVAPLLIAAIIVLRAGTGEWPSWYGAEGDALSQARSSSRVTRVFNAVNAYSLCFGEFPPALENVVEAGLLAAKDLSTADGLPYRYRRLDESGSFKID